MQKDGEPVPITAKAFDLLAVLIENHGQPISKEELMQKVWPDNKTVTDNTFSVTLSHARKR
ncbi:MAG: winged helix-turn-helix domain-containing protein [Acidobacteriota bacterium]|nr:winged helix-turn-helix domain-containing protein [Acidobacteriota bacterium]